MRPCTIFFLLALSAGCILTVLHLGLEWERRSWTEELPGLQRTFALLQLTDLAVSTEARYTRHPAVSDPVVPFMDHPGGLEHFPSGSFFTPVVIGDGQR